jgi:L-asparaginase/Glu-tRNA(Gln) amidotransferase subunit D
MTTYTNLEVLTYNAILEVCNNDAAADIRDIASMTGKSPNILRGVISSLLKKGMIEDVDENLFAPCVDGVCFTHGGDSLTESELELFVKLEA